MYIKNYYFIRKVKCLRRKGLKLNNYKIGKVNEVVRIFLKCVSPYINLVVLKTTFL